MPPFEIYRLLYVSRTHIDPCGTEPRRILDVSTARNAALHVTGLLCYSGDHFAQILEGPPAAIATLMTAIRADIRHRMLREWPTEPAPNQHRLFPGWAMGYTHDDRLDQAMKQIVNEAPGIALDTMAGVLFAGLALYRGQQSD